MRCESPSCSWGCFELPQKVPLNLCDITQLGVCHEPLQLARCHLGVICHNLGVCHAPGHRSMNLIAISSCPSSLFSTSYLRANIPSVVPLPCLNSSCSSPIPLTLQRLFCHPRFFPETSTYGLAT